MVISEGSTCATGSGITTSIRGTAASTVNPGPVDTGYMSPELLDRLAPQLPFGRVGEPDDPARLIEWLVSDEGRWMTGQVLSSEGGFARWRAVGESERE